MGGLKQPAVFLTKELLALIKRRDQVWLGAVPGECYASLLGPLSGLGDVEEDSFHFSVMGFVPHQ